MTRPYYALALILLLAQCTGQQDQQKTVKQTNHHSDAKVYTAMNTGYRALTAKDSIKNFSKYFSAPQQAVILSVNRIDADNIAKLDTLIIPADMSGSVIQYSPFPQSAPFLKDVEKIIFFSYPAQYFGAYEYGTLVLSGPTSMGRKADQTKTGLFYTNWKAEKTTSTFNDEWELKWNFNIENKEGIGFHQYALPGYPASHSCLRLLESDAKFLYSWADQWVLKGTDDIKAHGTPVVVFGAYPFGSPRPWLQLLSDPHALAISEAALKSEAQSYLQDIMGKQQQREAVVNKVEDSAK